MTDPPPLIVETCNKTSERLSNVLVATDFSPGSENALLHGVAIARRFDAELFLAHVIGQEAYELMPPESRASAVHLARRRAEQSFSDLMVSGTLNGVPRQVLLGEGEVWPVLSAMIKEHGVELVVGSHERLGIPKLLLGSVAEEVFRMAPCPVITVGPGVPRDSARKSFRHVLLATDLSSRSERAARYAFSFSAEDGARLTLLHVVKDAAAVSAGTVAVLQKFYKSFLEKMAAREAKSAVPPEFAVAFGEPAAEILSVARARGANLIVMGVSGDAAFPAHLPPGTAYKIVCQSACPVLTVGRIGEHPPAGSVRAESNFAGAGPKC